MSEQGQAGDAIDFAVGHCGPEEAVAFLDDWRADKAGEWPGYVRWLGVQRAGALAIRKADPVDNGSVERVARAIHHAEAEPNKDVTFFGEVWDWDDVLPPVRDRYLRLAQAVLLAALATGDASKDDV